MHCNARASKRPLIVRRKAFKDGIIGEQMASFLLLTSIFMPPISLNCLEIFLHLLQLMLLLLLVKRERRISACTSTNLFSLLKGGAITIYPQDQHFGGWHFIHYSVSTKNNYVRKRTLTFVHTTISAVPHTTTGQCTVDNEHAQDLKDSMQPGGVVSKVLNAFGVDITNLCYDERRKKFIVTTKRMRDTVRFVMLTSAPLPVRTGKRDPRRTKKDMQNLIVYRSEVEHLGIVFSE